MDLADSVESARTGRCRDAHAGVAMLAAGESDPRTVHSIAAYHVEDLGILFARRAKGSAASGDIIEQIFDLLTMLERYS